MQVIWASRSVVCVVQPVGAANVKVYGPAVDAPVQAHTVSYLIVDCKEAGPGQRWLVMLASNIMHMHKAH